MPGESYEGAVCYVAFDHDAADGHALKGGNHYSVVEGPDGLDMAGERLYLDPESGKYSFADDADGSYADRYPGTLKICAIMGGVGEPQTDEDYAATYRHLDELEARLEAEGPHPQEHDHICRTPEEVRVVRTWLQQADARRQQ